MVKLSTDTEKKETGLQLEQQNLRCDLNLGHAYDNFSVCSVQELVSAPLIQKDTPRMKL